MPPELHGKLDGFAIGVPTNKVLLEDLSFIAPRDTTVNEVNALMKAAGIDRLQPSSSVVELRLDLDQNLGPSAQGGALARLRVGLLPPWPNDGHAADPPGGWRGCGNIPCRPPFFYRFAHVFLARHAADEALRHGDIAPAQMCISAQPVVFKYKN